MGRKSKEELSRKEKVARENLWKKENQRRYNIAFSIASYSDVIQKLESVPAKNQYIARLIREDLRREEKKEE